jgi:integrase
MTWVPSQRLWKKMYRGKVYRVTVRQLRDQGRDVLDDTKEGSRIAANAWWDQRRFEVDAAARRSCRPPEPLEDVMAAYLGDADAFRDPDTVHRLLFSQIAEKVKARETHAAALAAHVEDEDAPYDPNQVALAAVRNAVESFLTRHLVGGEPLPPQLACLLPPARVTQIEGGIKSLRGEPAAAPDKRLAFHRDRWLDLQRSRVLAGEMTPRRMENLQFALDHLVAFLGADSAADAVTARSVEDFYRFCLGKVAEKRADPKAGWSAGYARFVFATARRFIRYLGEQGLMPLPPNLLSRDHKFNDSAAAIVTWTPEEVTAVFAKAPERLRLIFLLMLNCGMTQQDVSDLTDSEVNWVAGRITRKRSKTAGQKNTPTVEYLLWPETFRLLQNYRSGGPLPFLTESGRPWVRAELLPNGKVKKCDSAQEWWRGFRKNHLPGFTKTLKQLRKTAASLLAQHVDGSYVDLFLGHAPRSMADRHYVKPDQQKLDEAVTWLGRQLGQVAGT